MLYNALSTVSGPVGDNWVHNYMTYLSITGSPPTYVIFYDESGNNFGFYPSGGEWYLDSAANNPGGNYYSFTPLTLTQSGSDWLLTYPDGNFYTFNGSGQLVSQTDRHGNVTSFTYTSGQLTAIAEPTGRQITLTYSDGLISSVTDPNGNVTHLYYDGSNNLTQAVGPSGCTTSYGYATPSNHLMTSRTDPNGNTYTMSYYPSGDYVNQLYQVTDAESPSNTITYSYGTVEEDGGSSSFYLSYTKLVDARSQSWQYVFDYSGHMWRIVDPLGHWRHYYWELNDKLLYETGGFQYTAGFFGGPIDNLNNIFRTAAYDAVGNMVQQADATGLVTTRTYNSQNLVTSVYPSQIDYATQGNWVHEYGTNGYVLCSFENASSDLQSLPSWISSVTPSSFTRTNYSGDDYLSQLGDPRAMVYPLDPNVSDPNTCLNKGAGFWIFSGSGPHVTIDVPDEVQFNLGIYTNSVDQGLDSSYLRLSYNDHTKSAVYLRTTRSCDGYVGGWSWKKELHESIWSMSGKRRLAWLERSA